MNGKHFWAYMVMGNGSVTLVCCQDATTAEVEKGRMRMSAAKTIGTVTVATDERTIRQHFARRGWRVALVRDFKPSVKMVGSAG